MAILTLADWRGNLRGVSAWQKLLFSHEESTPGAGSLRFKQEKAVKSGLRWLLSTVLGRLLAGHQTPDRVSISLTGGFISLYSVPEKRPSMSRYG